MKIFQNVLAVTALAALTFAQPPQAPKKKKLLAIGAVAGFQHDSVSNGLATMWKIGHDTGLWDTYIRTDTQLITKKKVPAGNAKNLDYFDAIYLYTTGELPLDDEQKASLLSFVHDDGKGIIGGHSAIDTLYKWPEYGEMMGAYFDNHPWGQFMAPIIIEDPNFPAMKEFPRVFTMMDEIYQPSKEFSRDKVRVLARLDETKINLEQKGVKRTDKDFAVAWVKTYGNGRVFYSTFGHREEVYDRPDIQAMYREATKWAMKLVDGDAPAPSAMKFSLSVLLALASGANAEVLDSAANGFTVRTTLNIKAAPDEVFDKFLHNIGDWWNPMHTFSGDAKNLRIEDRLGGCLCEKLPNNGFVRHLEVVYLSPGKAITFFGGLGPMQSLAATGSMVIRLAPADGGTKFEMTYAVTGYLAKGLNTWAAPADMMTSEQFTRLKSYVETGKAASK